MKFLINLSLVVTLILGMGVLHAQNPGKNSYHFRSASSVNPSNAKAIMDEIRSAIDVPVQLNYNQKSGEFNMLSDVIIDLPSVLKSLEKKGLFMMDTSAGMTGNTASETHSPEQVAERYRITKSTTPNNLPVMVMTQSEYDQIPESRKQQLLEKWQIEIR